MTTSTGTEGLRQALDIYNRSTTDSSPDNARQILANRGVLHLRNFIASSDIRYIKSELDHLFDNFQHLPKQIKPKADSHHKSTIREIANLVTHNKVFRDSVVYQQCYQLASEIFGRQCRYGFDHAIYKSPGSCLLYTSPSPRDRQKSRMPSSA